MKDDLGNVQLGFIRQNHRAQQMLRTVSKTLKPFRTLPKRTFWQRTAKLTCTSWTVGTT